MNERLLRALRREPVDRTPVWFMRQAGRCLPRYHELRGDGDMFELLRDPDAAAEITLLPLEYFPVDALVLYNDLATPFLGAGIGVRIVPGVGPVVDLPIQTPADVDRLRPFEPRERLEFNLEAIRRLVVRVDLPVIGFVGAPFTLASYQLPGSRARRLERARSFMWEEAAAWDRLLDYWATQLAEFAIAQAEAGAAAIQVFDSWAGCLSSDDYDARVLPHSRRMLRRLAEAGVPTIHFATGNPALLPSLARAGGDAIGVDWRIRIDRAWEAIGPERAIQGNLDPAALLAGEEVAVRKTREILDQVGGRPGHIFNLGHGILPETDPAVLRAVVAAVHDHPASA